MSTKRLAMGPARKRRIHEARGGLCYICREPVPMFGKAVRYDHIWQLAHDGPDVDSNVGCAHRAGCDEKKTAQDAHDRGKVRRLKKKEAGEVKPKAKIKSRGFAPGKRPFPKGRGFQSRKGR